MNLQYPLISFIIAAYNEEKYIIECIESCLNQTYKNIEICITDDGSIDNTWKILISRYQSNTRVKLGRFTKNRGKVAAFNNSFRISKGKYIAIMGADDICLSDRIKDSIKNIGKYDLIFGNLASFNENGIISNNLMKEYFGIAGDQEITFIQLVKKPIVYGNTIFGHRELFRDIFPIDENFQHEDWWIPVVAAYKQNIKFVDKIFVKYRRHNAQTNVLSGTLYEKYKKWKYLQSREKIYYFNLIKYFILPNCLKREIKSKYYNCLLFESKSIKEKIRNCKYYLKYSNKYNSKMIFKLFIVCIFSTKLLFYIKIIKNILLTRRPE